MVIGIIEIGETMICNPDCQRCTISKAAKHVCVCGDGPQEAEVMLVGEAPGKSEDRHDMPFVGPIGQFLRDDILPAAGIDGDDVFFSNVGRCWPKSSKKKTRRPSAVELRNCRSYLEQEIKWLRPKVIVAMGNAPLASLLDFIYKSTVDDEGNVVKEGKVSGITKWQGKKIWSQEFKCWILPTFHPSYVSRLYKGKEDSSYAFNLLVADLEEAVYLASKPRPRYPIPKITIVNNSKQAVAMLNEMWLAGTFAFDIETGGKGRACDKYVIGCSFASSSKAGYYVDWELFKGDDYLYGGLKRLLYSRKHMKIMHNGSYELKILKFARMNIWDKYYDTKIAAHMVDENFGKSLKDLSWVYTKFGGYDTSLEKYKTEHRIKEDYSQVSSEILPLYGGLDSVATYALYECLTPILEKERSKPAFDRIMMPVRRVMSEAEINGMRVNGGYAEELHDRCDHAFELLEERVYDEAGKEFNLNSRKQLADVLYIDIGYEPLKQTKGKTGYSVDADSIEHVSKQGGDIAKFLMDRSYLKTMNGTHISQALRFRWDDERVHTNYNMTGAVTGRTTCGKPGIHNVPRDRLIRTMYIASEGCMFVEADLRSAELAYLAAESGEEVFLRAFAEGLDPHMETAKIIYDKDDPTAEERANAKNTNYAVIYGITVRGLSKRLGISEEEAEDFIDIYFDKLPKIAAHLEYRREMVREQGWVESLFKYRRRLPMGMSDIEYDIARAERQAMNAPIQNGAALYTYIGLFRLWLALRKYRLRAKIVHTVHDCGITDTPRPEIEQVKELAVIAFETPVKVVSVQMQADISVSKAWGEDNEDSKLYDILDSVGLAKGLVA